MVPQLPATYLRHLVDPHGLGDLEHPHAAGECGSMVGGRGVRLSLTWRACRKRGSVIEAARARVFGSVGLRGPVSWLTQTLEGCSHGAACEITAGAVLSALTEGNGFVPPGPVVRGAELAVEALRRALGVAHGAGPADLDGRGILVCRCVGVGDRPIRAAIRAGARDPEAIGDATGACTGCRSCRPDLMALLDEELRGGAPRAPEGSPPVAQVVWACVGPVLRALGLPLARVEVAAEAVRLGFGSPEPWACISPLGALAQARQVLRDTVSEQVRVEGLPSEGAGP